MPEKKGAPKPIGERSLTLFTLFQLRVVAANSRRFETPIWL
jgi:hypothetical protein